jgi:hypothetical protein
VFFTDQGERNEGRMIVENFEAQYKLHKKQEDQRAAKLVAALTRAGRQNELFMASESAKYRELLYKEFEIDKQ